MAALLFAISNGHGKPISFWIPSLSPFVGLGLGWFFGYKLGFTPLFTGFYTFSKEDEDGGAVQT